MDDLNKTQVVLLTLFVSFVTSIATGIVTVTLLEQAPVGVTQTINRVVEHTVERIVPGETKTTVKEVLITGDDVIAHVVDQSKNSFVRVEVVLDPDSITEEQPASSKSFTGVLTSAQGVIISSRDILTLPRKTIEVTLASGQTLRAELLTLQNTDVAVLKLAQLPKQKLSFLSLQDRMPALGEPVIGLGLQGKSSSITLGRIAKVDASAASSSPLIYTDVTSEWPVLGTGGELLGMARKDGRLITAREIHALIDQINKLKTERPTSAIAASSTPAQEASVGAGVEQNKPVQ